MFLRVFLKYLTKILGTGSFQDVSVIIWFWKKESLAVWARGIESLSTPQHTFKNNEPTLFASDMNGMKHKNRIKDHLSRNTKQFTFDDVIMWIGCINYWHVHADCSQPLDFLIILSSSFRLRFNNFKNDSSLIIFVRTSVWFLSLFLINLGIEDNRKLSRQLEFICSNHKNSFSARMFMQIFAGNNQERFSR